MNTRKLPIDNILKNDKMVMRMKEMHCKAGFSLMELLMSLLIVGILLGMVLPNIRVARAQALTAAVQLNMRHVATAIAAYYAENGHYADDFYEDGYGYIFDGGKKDEQLGALPINPYTGAMMDPDDFNVDEYDSESDIANTSEGGPNDEWGYSPGEMSYRTWTPLGNYYPQSWGLIGFEGHGVSIRKYDQDGNPVIFVMY